MKKKPMNLLLGSAALLAILLAGCRIPVTIPYKSVAPKSELNKADTVVVALTSANFKHSQRRSFFAQNRNVMKDMVAYDGLLGYSVRFQILGTQAWTMSVWRDEAARDRFVSAQVHARAMKEGYAMLNSFKTVSITIPASKTPLPWSEAMKIIEKNSE